LVISKPELALHIKIIDILAVRRAGGRFGECALEQMRPAGFEVQAAVEVPTRRQLDLLADEIIRIAGFVAQFGRRPAVLVLRQPEEAVADEGLHVRKRVKTDAVARRIDIAAGKGAVDAGRSEFEAAGAVEGVELLILVVVGIVIAAGIVVMERETRRPKSIESITDVEMLIPGRMVEILAVARLACLPHRAELADRFALEIELPFRGLDVKTHAWRKIAAVAGLHALAVAFVEVVQVQFGIELAGQVVDLQKPTGKPRLLLGFVEAVEVVEQLLGIVRIAADRLGREGVELPAVVIDDSEPEAVEAVDRVAHRIPGDQAAAAEIQGLPAGDRFDAQTAMGQVLIGPGQITLDEIGFIDMGIVDAGTLVGAKLAGIQKFAAQPPVFGMRFQPQVGLQRNLLIAALTALPEAAVDRFIAGTLFER